MLKYSGVVPYVRRHTDKVIKPFKKLVVNVEISNNAAMVKRISNGQTEKRGRRTKAGCTRSPVDNATVSTSGKFSTRMKEHAKSKAMTNHCLEHTAMTRDAPAKQQTPHRDFHQ
mgnify:CR=1 FL=1